MDEPYLYSIQTNTTVTLQVPSIIIEDDDNDEQYKRPKWCGVLMIAEVYIPVVDDKQRNTNWQSHDGHSSQTAVALVTAQNWSKDQTDHIASNSYCIVNSIVYTVYDDEQQIELSAMAKKQEALLIWLGCVRRPHLRRHTNSKR